MATDHALPGQIDALRTRIEAIGDAVAIFGVGEIADVVIPELWVGKAADWHRQEIRDAANQASDAVQSLRAIVNVLESFGQTVRSRIATEDAAAEQAAADAQARAWAAQQAGPFIWPPMAG